MRNCPNGLNSILLFFRRVYFQFNYRFQCETYHPLFSFLLLFGTVRRLVFWSHLNLSPFSHRLLMPRFECGAVLERVSSSTTSAGSFFSVPKYLNWIWNRNSKYKDFIFVRNKNVREMSTKIFWQCDYNDTLTVSCSPHFFVLHLLLNFSFRVVVK